MTNVTKGLLCEGPALLVFTYTWRPPFGPNGAAAQKRAVATGSLPTYTVALVSAFVGIKTCFIIITQ